MSTQHTFKVGDRVSRLCGRQYFERRRVGTIVELGLSIGWMYRYPQYRVRWDGETEPDVAWHLYLDPVEGEAK